MNIKSATGSRAIRLKLLVGAAACLQFTAPVHAQVSSSDPEDAESVSSQASSTGAPGDIVVTARKRAESIMKTPVVLQAIPAEQIENLRINSINDISIAVPSLEIQTAFSSVGATVNLRGLGNANSAVYVDQSVGLNVDGASLAHGAFFRTGLFDVGQIDVLKGPQALFYGKSTSAGLVAVRTADPTAEWETKLSGGYEFKADETDINGYVSGPLSPDLGLRVAGFRREIQGYLTNPNPNNPEHRGPQEEEYGGRVTLKYAPAGSSFNATLKVTAYQRNGNFGTSDIKQHICGGSQVRSGPYAAFDNCKLDLQTAGNPVGRPYNPAVPADPTNGAFWASSTADPLFKDGRSYTRLTTRNAVLNLAYDVTPGLELSSLSTYTSLRSSEAGRNFLGSNVPSILDIATANRFKDFSEEVRLTSDWRDSWINFMIGGYYSETTRKGRTVLEFPNFPTAVPGVTIGRYFNVGARELLRSYSGFGQVLIRPTETLELAAGARYSHVRRGFEQLFVGHNVGGCCVAEDQTANVPAAARRIKESDFSPEVTLTYRPTDDVTTFVSYKQGYKGPGLGLPSQLTTFTPASITKLAGERAEGFEGGVKAQLFDRQLALTLSAYTYKYRNLQIAIARNNAVVLQNAASARVKGIEAGLNFRPSALPGVSLGAELNYNSSRYISFPESVCYAGQTAALGCVFAPGATRGSQDLSGRPLSFAPEWTGALSAGYKSDVGNGYMLDIDAHMRYSGEYFAQPDLHPLSRQRRFAQVDAGVRFGREDGVWEVALLGRNLTNKLYFSATADANNGGDIFAYVNRPRQIFLQFTIRPNF